MNTTSNNSHQDLPILSTNTTTCYLIDKEGFLAKMPAYKAERLIDYKTWFYTDKEVYNNYTKAGLKKAPNLIEKGAVINGELTKEPRPFHIVFPYKVSQKTPKVKSNKNKRVQHVIIKPEQYNLLPDNKKVDYNEYKQLGRILFYSKKIYHAKRISCST